MSARPNVLAMLIEAKEQLAAIATEQRLTNERIFGAAGQTGILERLAEKDVEVSNALVAFKVVTDGNFDLIRADVAGIKTDSRVQKAYTAGAGAALALVVKLALSKVGWHF